MRIVHLPARTPYAWKLQTPEWRILNATTIADGVTVPTGVTADWLLQHRPLRWMDVLHLHHMEFEDLDKLEQLLDACADSRVRIVHTVHDTKSMFGANSDLQKKLRVLAAADIGWICLTHGSAAELREITGSEIQSTVIPHGYVAEPMHLVREKRETSTGRLRYLLFGAIRPNRDHLSTVTNWSLASTNLQNQLHLLMRGLSPAHFAPPSRVPQLLDTIRADPRITTTIRPYPTNNEVINAGRKADALILPYLWGTHSGQLELAFDLNLLPLCSSVGYLPEQAAVHRGLATEPEWFDWTNGNPYEFGERFVAALERTDARLRATNRNTNPQFLEYRQEEHKEILNAYQHVYTSPG